VPSIDRGRRRLARVYKTGLSSIKRVLGCNLAITRTCRALATHHPYNVSVCMYCYIRVWYALARACTCVRKPRRLRVRGRLDALPRGLCEASSPARLATDFTRIGRAIEWEGPRAPRGLEKREWERKKKGSLTRFTPNEDTLSDTFFRILTGIRNEECGRERIAWHLIFFFWRNHVSQVDH
jgi:hypothetical protein